jgi:hypothetical protein
MTFTNVCKSQAPDPGVRCIGAVVWFLLGPIAVAALDSADLAVQMLSAFFYRPLHSTLRLRTICSAVSTVSGGQGLSVCVVGSGPAGFYTVDKVQPVLLLLLVGGA